MDVSPVASLNALPPIEVTVPGIIADPAQLESPLTAFSRTVKLPVSLQGTSDAQAGKLLTEVAPTTITLAKTSFLKCLILEVTLRCLPPKWDTWALPVIDLLVMTLRPTYLRSRTRTDNEG